MFSSGEGTCLGIGFELREAVLATEVRSGCARRFYGVLLIVGLLGATSVSMTYGIPQVHEVFPPILLGLLWIEVFIMYGIWVWARRQPLAASITAFVFILTGAVVNLIQVVPLLKGPTLIPAVFQIILQAGFLALSFQVVVESRNPLGRSKLSTALALSPAPIELASSSEADTAGSPVAEGDARVGLSVSQSPPEVHADLDPPEVAAAAQTATNPAASVSVPAAQKPPRAPRTEILADNLRTVRGRLPSWIEPIPLRVFQAAVIAVVLFQLHRVSTVITGPMARFSPFRSAGGFAVPLVALSDTVVGLVTAFGLIKGLALLIGNPGVNRGYWLKILPRGAIIWGALATLRVVVTVVSVDLGSTRLGYTSSDFFFLMAADAGTAALCIIGYRLWKKHAIGE